MGHLFPLLAASSHSPTKANSPPNHNPPWIVRPLSHCPGPAKVNDASQQATAVHSRSRLDAPVQSSFFSIVFVLSICNLQSESTAFCLLSGGRTVPAIAFQGQPIHSSILIDDL